MTVREYTAQWYESDEYDQWIAAADCPDLDTAKRVAFKQAMRNWTHAICYVTVRELRNLDYGPDWVTTQELVNHHDGPRWSGWIKQSDYDY